jgi:hypothetical protein
VALLLSTAIPGDSGTQQHAENILMVHFHIGLPGIPKDINAAEHPCKRLRKNEINSHFGPLSYAG